MNSRLIITDIDQTITVPGIDIWEHITTSLVHGDKINEYKNEFAEYKKTSSADPVGASKKMMENAVNMFGGCVDSDVIYQAAAVKINSLIRDRGIRDSSVELLIRFIAGGGKVILSTANYQEAACAIRDNLFQDEEIKKHVLVSGSVVDWEAKVVEHINVAENKVTGIMNELKITEDELKKRTHLVFGDDPVVNDIALFRLKKDSCYLIETPKNRHIEIPAYLKRSSWTEVHEDMYS
jgi:hypothetical protein